jgi:hypothetical protein
LAESADLGVTVIVGLAGWRAMKGAKKMLVLDTTEFFMEAVEDGTRSRRMAISPVAKNYLVELLRGYVSADKLYEIEEETGIRRQSSLAEMLLRAVNSENSARIELLKRLGDVSLYVAGFFGDSLERKVVDVDYYAQMGALAYGSLARSVHEETFSLLYTEYSERFLDFVELLTYISQKSLIQSDTNLLRLYDRFLRTGSEIAKEHLLEKGLIPVNHPTKPFRQ